MEQEVDGRELSLRRGLEEAHRARAAQFLWDAWSWRLGPYLPAGPAAMAYYASCINADGVLSAVGPDGALWGYAGFSYERMHFFRPVSARAIGGLGPWRGAWLHYHRALHWADTRRRIPDGVVLLGGVFTDPARRESRAGRALLTGVIDTTRERKAHTVVTYLRNPAGQARAVYERYGFVYDVGGAFGGWRGAGKVVSTHSRMVLDLDGRSAPRPDTGS